MSSSSLYRPRPRHWPQYSLRAFFLLLTILGLSLGWCGVQLRWIRDREQVIQESMDHDRITYYTLYRFYTHNRNIGPCPWSLRLFGEDGYALIGVRETSNAKEDADLLGKLERLFPEAQVKIAAEFDQPLAPK